MLILTKHDVILHYQNHIIIETRTNAYDYTPILHKTKKNMKKDELKKKK